MERLKIGQISKQMDHFDEINNSTRFFIEKIAELPGNGLEIQIVFPRMGYEQDILRSYGQNAPRTPHDIR
ncbi:hypothetical protein GCM10007415_42410 [Parapedobacter pyrenivorans]|uniref:Uncharacterized protein n=1 Tax=Parapedobacter pyrenivorans TaxID=1305674 RepID=A0A917I2A9_9SPHI|nr:hypothetical protein GCM10007415_42410 [Parapedobacter pyrenivorans]